MTSFYTSRVIQSLRVAAVSGLLTTFGACQHHKDEPTPDLPEPVVTTFEKYIPATANTSVVMTDIITATDGNVLVTGYTSYPYYFTGATEYVAKRSATTGDTIWTRRFNYSWTQQGGLYKSRSTWGIGIVQAADGSIIVAGATESPYFANNGFEKILLTKFSSTGAVLWSKILGDVHEGLYGGGNLAATADGGFLVLVNPFEGMQTSFQIIKADGNGNVVRTNSYPGAFAGEIKPTADGNFVVTGAVMVNNDSQVFLTKITPAGTVVWNSILGDNQTNHAHAVVQTADGGYAITGVTEVPGLGRQMMLLRTNATGQQQFLKGYGQAKEDTGLTITVNRDGQYVIGGFQNASSVLTAEPVAITVAADGTELTRKTIPGPDGRLLAAYAAPDGGLLFCGHSASATGFVWKTRKDLSQ